MLNDLSHRQVFFVGYLLGFYIVLIFYDFTFIYEVFLCHSKKSDLKKRNDIKKFTEKAFNQYKKYAWGYDFLAPITKNGKNTDCLGYTIIDSIDTFILMDMEEAYEDSLNWIENNFSLICNVSVFESTIRVIGGLISAYEMTGDYRLLNAAQKLGDKLMFAFETPYGLPHSIIELKNNIPYDWAWSSGESLLAESGSIQIEMMALSYYTGNYTYWKTTKRALRILTAIGSLVPTRINYDTLSVRNLYYTFDAFGDSYYEYLLKLYLYAPKNCSFIKNKFEKSIKSASKTLLRRNKDRYFFSTIKNKEIHYEESHLSYFLPGTLMLAYKYHPGKSRELYKFLSKKLLAAHLLNHRSNPSKLSGESYSYDKGEFVVMDDKYKLRPEFIESIFYSWRIFSDPKSKKIAWKIYQNIKKYCFVDNSFTTVSSVNKKALVHENLMDSFFLSETMKYLYLIFSDKSVFNLDEYIFTTEAHPLKKLNFV